MLLHYTKLEGQKETSPKKQLAIRSLSNGGKFAPHSEYRSITQKIRSFRTFCLWLTTPESRSFSDGFVAIANSESKTVRIYCHPQFQDKLRTYALDEGKIVLNDGQYTITVTLDEGEFRGAYGNFYNNPNRQPELPYRREIELSAIR